MSNKSIDKEKLSELMKNGWSWRSSGGSADDDCVKSVNDVSPNEDGNVDVCYPEVVSFGDYSAFQPGYVVCTSHDMKGLKEIFSAINVHVVFSRTVFISMNPLKSYSLESTRMDLDYTEAGVIYRVHFGEDLCPILINTIDDTITLDPDWTSPVNNYAKSVNGISPNEDGSIDNRVSIKYTESDGTISVAYNPDLFWQVMYDSSPDGLKVELTVVPNDANAVFYQLTSYEITEMAFSSSWDVVSMIYRFSFCGAAPDLRVDVLKRTITLDPDWVKPTDGTSIILKSPNGSRFEITVSDDGQLNATSIAE